MVQIQPTTATTKNIILNTLSGIPSLSPGGIGISPLWGFRSSRKPGLAQEPPASFWVVHEGPSVASAPAPPLGASGISLSPPGIAQERQTVGSAVGLERSESPTSASGECVPVRDICPHWGQRAVCPHWACGDLNARPLDSSEPFSSLRSEKASGKCPQRGHVCPAVRDTFPSFSRAFFFLSVACSRHAPEGGTKKEKGLMSRAL